MQRSLEKINKDLVMAVISLLDRKFLLGWHEKLLHL